MTQDKKDIYVNILLKISSTEYDKEYDKIKVHKRENIVNDS